MFGDADLTLLYSGNMGKAHDFMPFLHLARMLNRINPKIIFCFACRGNRMAELKQQSRPETRTSALLHSQTNLSWKNN